MADEKFIQMIQKGYINGGWDLTSCTEDKGCEGVKLAHEQAMTLSDAMQDGVLTQEERAKLGFLSSPTINGIFGEDGKKLLKMDFNDTMKILNGNDFDLIANLNFSVFLKEEAATIGKTEQLKSVVLLTLPRLIQEQGRRTRQRETLKKQLDDINNAYDRVSSEWNFGGKKHEGIRAPVLRRIEICGQGPGCIPFHERLEQINAQARAELAVWLGREDAVSKALEKLPPDLNQNGIKSQFDFLMDSKLSLAEAQRLAVVLKQTGMSSEYTRVASVYPEIR